MPLLMDAADLAFQELEHADEAAPEELAEMVRAAVIRFSIASNATGGSTAHRKAFRRAQTDTTIR